MIYFPATILNSNTSNIRQIRDVNKNAHLILNKLSLTKFDKLSMQFIDNNTNSKYRGRQLGEEEEL